MVPNNITIQSKQSLGHFEVRERCWCTHLPPQLGGGSSDTCLFAPKKMAAMQVLVGPLLQRHLEVPGLPNPRIVGIYIRKHNVLQEKCRDQPVAEGNNEAYLDIAVKPSGNATKIANQI